MGFRPEGSRVSCVTFPRPPTSLGLSLQRASELGEPKQFGMGLGAGKEGSCAALSLMVTSAITTLLGEQLEPLTQRWFLYPRLSHVLLAPCQGLGPVPATVLSLSLSSPISAFPLSLSQQMPFSLDITFWKSSLMPLMGGRVPAELGCRALGSRGGEHG